MKYLRGNRDNETSNTYAKYGSFMHFILEKLAKKEFTKEVAIVYYIMNYKDQVGEFPVIGKEDYSEQYYQAGLDYLKSLEFDWDRYEILGVEKEVRFKLADKYDFIGYIDLLLRDKNTGEIIILDHKSADIGFRQDGTVYKKDEKHFEDFKKQLYLYSYWVKKEYGRVDKLAWNHFKQGNITSVKWDEMEMKNALAWALKTIWMIKYNDTIGCGWELNESFFYCRMLCSMESLCWREKNGY